MTEIEKKDHAAGIAAGAGAYILWGILPLYWKLIDYVPSEEILAHRMIWSFAFMLIVLLVLRRTKKFVQELKDLISNQKKLVGLTLAAIFITINWYTYIWAVNNNHVVEASLGYYINPLVSVLLGIIVLKERLSFWQIVSFILATIGVLNLTIHFGDVPWVAIALALSFGLYGLLKKMTALGALTGLTIETMLITPIALLYVSFLVKDGTNSFVLSDPSTSMILLGAGIVTAIPLLLFATGANRISLSMIGFLQYFAPTIMLFIGVFLYHETFSQVHLTSFIFIWIALAIFTLGNTKLLARFEPRLSKTKSYNH
ncbi:EamA family transporter RarD [Pseudalkalibacillus berkeleyi]|uniref:EamA family transporter RarD n=1 Tax=Pseudalkalibacillus berkeleyi TaxID=1069813 RepID=A0ABS9H2S3_9BACL|nr:EamA family transporter RarD [Pseudalkalibacillus berkeleyi]MCF6139247.1 EamA family transporter RarD [Pseudalkalibacillus berkeleyi]